MADTLPEVLNPVVDPAPSGIDSYGGLPTVDARSPQLREPVYDPASAITAGFNSFVSKPASPDAALASTSFDWKRSNADRFVNTDYYKELGFDPNRDNESLYGYRQTWGNTMSNAFAGMWRLGASGFIDGWKGWGRMYDALTSWDWSKLAGDPESLQKLNDNQQDIMNRFAIYATPESDDTFWNRKTFGNFLQQSGFTLGTLAQTATEQILTKAIEAAIFLPTAGAGSVALEAAEDTRAAANLGRLAETLNLSKTARDLNSLGSIWKEESAMSKFYNSVLTKVPGVQWAKDLSTAYNQGANLGHLVRIGVGGIKRGLSEANLAMTEARMEAAGTYGQLYNQLYYDYQDKHGGAQPIGKDLEDIVNTAYGAGKDNFVFNSMLLSAMNRIQFDNLFKSFKTSSRLSQIFGLGEEGADNLLNVTGKIGGQDITQVYKKGALGTLGQLGNIAKDFGKNQAAKELGYSVLSHLGKWEVTEGIQELLQNGSNDYFTDYYNDLYKSQFDPSIRPDKEKSKRFAIDNELNMQGLKTFISGALTGLITSGPSKAVEASFERLGTSGEQRKAYNKDLTAHLSELNGFLKDPSSYLSEVNKGFKIQFDIANNLDKALKENNKFAFENLRDTALGQLASRALRMNTHEALIDTLRDYGNHFTPEQFQQAFSGYDYKESNQASIKAYTDRIANSIQSYVDTYQDLSQKLDSRINPELFPKNSKLYKEAMFAKGRIADIVDILASNKEKAKRTYERMTDIVNSAASSPGIGSSLSTTFNVLGSKENTLNELSLLRQQLQTLNEAVDKTKQVKDDLARTKEQLEALENWRFHQDRFFDHEEIDGKYKIKDQTGKISTTFETYDEALAAISNLHKESMGKMKEAFKKYVGSKNEQSDVQAVVTDDDFNKHYSDLEDYIKLGEKAQNHINSYNYLTNPRHFGIFFDRMMRGARIASLQIQLDTINDSMGKAGFSYTHRDLVAKINEFRKATGNDLSDEEVNDYYKTIQDLADRAVNYTDDQVRAFQEKLKAVKEEEEFKEQNKDLLGLIGEMEQDLAATDPSGEDYGVKNSNLNIANKLLDKKAEEYLVKNGESDTTTTETKQEVQQSEVSPTEEATETTPAPEEPKATEKELLDDFKANLALAKTDEEVTDLENALSDAFADPTNDISKFSSKPFSDAVKERRAELRKTVSFANTKPHSVIQYTQNGKTQLYYVTSKSDKSLNVKEYPTGSTAVTNISEEDFNKNAKAVWRTKEDYQSTLPTEQQITVEETRKAAESAKAVEALFKDTERVAKLVQEGKNMSVEDAFKDLQDLSGCE